MNERHLASIAPHISHFAWSILIAAHHLFPSHHPHFILSSIHPFIDPSIHPSIILFFTRLAQCIPTRPQNVKKSFCLFLHSHFMYFIESPLIFFSLSLCLFSVVRLPPLLPPLLLLYRISYPFIVSHIVPPCPTLLCVCVCVCVRDHPLSSGLCSLWATSSHPRPFLLCPPVLATLACLSVLVY